MTLPPSSPAPSPAPSSGLLAAIDIGSNSFHLLVAAANHGELRPLEARGEKVQLAAGLHANWTRKPLPGG